MNLLASLRSNKSQSSSKMGNACESSTKSTAETSTDATRRNAAINRAIEQDRRANESTIKLLLLGAGESGKSTVLKQMKQVIPLLRLINFD